MLCVLASFDCYSVHMLGSIESSSLDQDCIAFLSDCLIWRSCYVSSLVRNLGSGYSFENVQDAYTLFYCGREYGMVS